MELREISEGLQAQVTELNTRDKQGGEKEVGSREGGRHLFSWHLCWKQVTCPNPPFTLSQHGSVIYAKKIQITFPRGSSSCQTPMCSNNTGTGLGGECCYDFSPLPVNWSHLSALSAEGLNLVTLGHTRLTYTALKASAVSWTSDSFGAFSERCSSSGASLPLTYSRQLDTIKIPSLSLHL